jgi:CRISPR system Cascade subunit CasC
LTKIKSKTVKKAFAVNSLSNDAADIALFGRMVANDHSLAVEATSMFSHALSTHKTDNEIDFFAAVDDLQPKEEAGAGMTGTLEFNSATYYRFAALNLNMLADGDHLESMSKEERHEVVRTFLEATIKAIPGARKNTMNGNTLPVYVLGIVREKGHPIQLVNAFESPVRPSKEGFAVKSIQLMNSEYFDLKERQNRTFQDRNSNNPLFRQRRRGEQIYSLSSSLWRCRFYLTILSKSSSFTRWKFRYL